MKREGHDLRSRSKHGTPEVSIYIAQLLTLADLEVIGVPEKPLPPGKTLLVRVSSSMLNLSRRQGGLRHRFGVVEGDGAVFGTLYVLGENELHLVLLDLTDPEVQRFVVESARNGSLKLLMVDELRSMRLMVTQSDDNFQVFTDAVKIGRTSDAGTFAMQLGDAMRFATSKDVLRQMGVNRKSLTEIQLSCVLTPQRVADVERYILGGMTH